MSSGTPGPSAEKASAFAKETIERRVEAYKYYRANRDTRTHVPSLVDLTAELLGTQSDEHIESIDPIILQCRLWDWHRIPYTMLRRGLHLLQQPSPALEHQIDEWQVSVVSNSEYNDNPLAGSFAMKSGFEIAVPPPGKKVLSHWKTPK